jgi:hypothetical protein
MQGFSSALHSHFEKPPMSLPSYTELMSALSTMRLTDLPEQFQGALAEGAEAGQEMPAIWAISREGVRTGLRIMMLVKIY